MGAKKGNVVGMTTLMRKRADKRGFTLAEVVLGILLVTLVATAFLVMFTSAYTHFFTLGAQTRAVNEAQQFFENYYTNSASIDSNVWKLVTTGLSGDLVAANSGFTRFYGIENVAPSGQAVTKVTAVVYYWNNSKRVEISTYVP